MKSEVELINVLLNCPSVSIRFKNYCMLCAYYQGSESMSLWENANPIWKRYIKRLPLLTAKEVCGYHNGVFEPQHIRSLYNFIKYIDDKINIVSFVRNYIDGYYLRGIGSLLYWIRNDIKFSGSLIADPFSTASSSAIDKAVIYNAMRVSGYSFQYPDLSILSPESYVSGPDLNIRLRFRKKA